MSTPEARRSAVADKLGRNYDKERTTAQLASMRAGGWRVDRVVAAGGPYDLWHQWGLVEGLIDFRSCCRLKLAGLTRPREPRTATCIYCALCHGCVACRDGMITEETTRLGFWVTRNRRMLLPFEMDDQHLKNAILALIREGDAYVKNHEDWLVVFKAEAKLRALKW